LLRLVAAYVLRCLAGFLIKVTGVQNGSGAHPASYSVGTSGSFPGDKAAGA